MVLNWNAVYVASRQEKKVYELLLQKGVEAYLPLVKTIRKWSDRKKVVEFPLLAGYVFVKIKSEYEKNLIVNVNGVVNFVRSNGKLGVIYEREIEALRQLISLGYHLESFPGTKKINKGDKILISSGPLKNLEGIVIDENNERLFQIFLEGIGYNLMVRLPEGVLKRA